MNEKITEVLNSADVIEEVKVSPFFKDKTLDLMFSEEKVTQTNWFWFTPKFQLATLICFFALNSYAFTVVNSASYNDSISDFAETHDLSVGEDTSLFN